jgi:hypothetical protein
MAHAAAIDTDASGLGPSAIDVIVVADGTTVACADAGWRPVAGIRKQRAATALLHVAVLRGWALVPVDDRLLPLLVILSVM